MGIKFKKLLHYLNKTILKIITVEFVVIVLSLGLFLLSHVGCKIASVGEIIAR